MKKTLLLLLLLPFCFAAAAEGAIDRAWVERNYRKTEYRIPMRDGVRLHTTVYAPCDTAGRHPILLTRTPYSCRPYGAEFSASLWKSFLKLYLEEGYILVFQDVRGRYMSEGEYVDLRPFIADKHSPEQIDEASDAYDTIDFLVREVAGNNGRVGVYGNSYPGFYALMAAASGHPALKAASPQAPVTDWFMGDDTHHNGVLFLRDAFSFIGGSFGRPMDNPTTEAAAAPRYVRTDEYDFFLRKATVDSLTQLLGDTVRFWNEMMRHPDYDDWWRERCSVRAMHDLRPAILVVGGLFDAEDCYGAWTTYASIRRQSPRTSCRMVAGPWVHGGWRSSNGGNRLGKIRFGDESLTDYYQQRIEVLFFNYYLLGKGDGGELAGATIFFTGENRWRTFEEWPPADARKEVLFLRSNGALSAERPIERESFSGYRSDPASPVPYDFPMHASRDKAYMVADQRFAAGRPDVLCFTTEPLAGDVTFAGGIRAVLQAAISTTDADFVVKLIDVWPDNTEYPGYQMLVRGDIMRGRYRRSFSAPEPFTPGEPTEVAFTMPDIAHTFRKGHRIMVQVQSSWFPLADRNPQQFVDIYRCAASDFIPCDVRIYHDRRRPSRLEVLRLR